MRVCSFKIANLLLSKKIVIYSSNGYSLNNIEYFKPRQDCESIAKFGDVIYDYENCEYYDSTSYRSIINAPYICQIFDWLREKKNIIITINANVGADNRPLITYCYNIIYINGDKFINKFAGKKMFDDIYNCAEESIEFVLNEII